MTDTPSRWITSGTGLAGEGRRDVQIGRGLVVKRSMKEDIVTGPVDLPLRIALLTNDITPFAVASGPGEAFRALAEGLDRAGHKVTVIGCDIHPESYSKQTWGEIVSLSGRKMRLVPRPWKNAFVVARELYKRRGSFDVLQCDSWPGLSGFVINRRLPRVVRLITSVAVDASVKTDRQVALQFVMEWLAIRRATLCLIASDFILEKSRKLYRLALPNFRKIPYALGDIDYSVPETTPKNVVRLITISGAKMRKGTDVLIRALSRLIEAEGGVDGFELEIIGPIWAHYDRFVEVNSELSPIWKRVVESLGSRLKIRYDVSDSEKVRALANADYLLVTSRSESFGIPVVEALRSGVSVVSSRGGALPEVAGVSTSSLFYDDPEDDAELAIVLQRIIAQGSDGAAERRAAARLAYEQHYRVDSDIQRIVSAYRHAVQVKHAKFGSTLG